MNPSQAPFPIQPWPPLITGSRLPRWVAIRDVLLTVMAWCLIGWLLRDSIYLAYDYLRHPVFQLTTAQPPDFVMIWGRLRYFVVISVALMVGLCLWALIDHRRLMALTHSSQPAPLTIAEQAARAGVGEASVSAAQQFKVTNVRFHEDGTLAGFEEVTLAKI